MPVGTDGRDAQLDQVLIEYFERVDRGEPVDPQQFLAAHPHLADELASFFDAVAVVDGAISSATMGAAPVAPATDRAAGDTIAQSPRLDLPGYQIGARISQGGMGVVYRGVQLSLGRDVALKVLHPSLASDEESLRRFRNEAAIAAQLTDAHVLPVFDIVESSGVPVLVMPFIDGCDLGQIILDRTALQTLRTEADGRQSRPAALMHPWANLRDQEYLERVLVLLDKLVAATAALHAAKVLHRDIKPSNVLIDRRGNLWLSDFGLARLGGQGHTLPGAILGTKGYMSPEQAAGEEDLDGRADLFSLGATIYQALTLQLPYGPVLIDRQRPLPKPPSKLQRLISRDYDGVILKALEPDPDHRYRTAAEFHDDWRRVRQGLSPKARPLGVVGRAVRVARRNPWRLAASGLLCAVIALAAWPEPAAVPEPSHYTVVVPTTPRATRGVLVPLSDYDGQPRAELALRHDPLRRDALVFRRVAPGDYLLVVDAGEAGFHEVYRHVPRLAETPGDYDHERWKRLKDASVELHAVAIRPAATDEMHRFEGSQTFVMGDDSLPPGGMSPHVHPVGPFFLDRHEVSVAQYRAVVGRLPQELEKLQPDDDWPVTFVSWDDAVQYAERCGKRLPTEAEYEFAATGGGTTLYPWGNSPPPKVWEIVPIHAIQEDRTPGDQPVFGLYSNVTEWTTSWLVPYSASRLVSNSDAIGNYLDNSEDHVRVVRGGPATVAMRQPFSVQVEHGPRYRHAQPREVTDPGLGLRMALSTRPRFLP
ncbi:MAG: SUMF1/EgtB/PvdO family nonheme iron enzyme [Planctomycetes bacterium]|nr:SUMF1/EgtB/PvdO family nonheme iron enzyme [Planctomycetota bacterium]